VFLKVAQCAARVRSAAPTSSLSYPRQSSKLGKGNTDTGVFSDLFKSFKSLKTYFSANKAPRRVLLIERNPVTFAKGPQAKQIMPPTDLPPRPSPQFA
jgi:hypothetical protein